MASADTSSSRTSDHEHMYRQQGSGLMVCSCGEAMSYEDWERMWKDIGGKAS